MENKSITCPSVVSKFGESALDIGEILSLVIGILSATGTHALIQIGEFFFNLAIFPEFAKSLNQKPCQSFPLYSITFETKSFPCM